MGDDHESYIVERLGGRKTPGSGSQWRNPLDGRHNRYEDEFAYAWDCKSTLAGSISVNLKVWEKTKERADGERPLMPLRFYHDERLKKYTDLVTMELEDFIELLDTINGLREELPNGDS